VSVNVEDLRNIRSGGGVIRYRVIGTRLFDNELPDLVIQTRMGDLTSNVSIPVVWNGTPAYRYRYVTESIQPGYEGEIVLEIDNLSDETWNVGHTEFLNRRLRIVQAPPDPVEPGETARFVLATTVAFDNSPGSLIVNLSARNITIPYPQTDSDQ
jgi:hypothetical protein